MQKIDIAERHKQIQEISLRKMAEHNDLISWVAKIIKIPLNMNELAVSCIDFDTTITDIIVSM